MKKLMRSALLDADIATCISLIRDGDAGTILDLPTEQVEIDGMTLTRQDGTVMRHSITIASRVGGRDGISAAGWHCGHLAAPAELEWRNGDAPCPVCGAGRAECPICGVYEAFRIPHELFWEDEEEAK